MKTFSVSHVTAASTACQWFHFCLCKPSFFFFFLLCQVGY